MTGIQWTDRTWNPVTGCTKVSPGCAHCYIERTWPFRKERRRFEWWGRAIACDQCLGEGECPRCNATHPEVTTGVRVREDRLVMPLKWTKPCRIFVCSMSDLFHEAVPFEFIAAVWQIMEMAQHHIFQVLTKRPERMLEFLEWLGAKDLPGEPSRILPNVWFGVSVENQLWAERRIPLLARVPAVVRFISAEPLLGPLDLQEWVGVVDAEGYCSRCGYSMPPQGHEAWPGQICPQSRLSWVIVGGESGPGRRSMEWEWVRDLRDQCQASGVPFFFEQYGGRTPKAGGRLLDGRTWDEMPAWGGQVVAGG